MKIGSVDTATDVLVVAEIGNNHEGSVAAAEEMIGRAAEAGCQAVKLQTFVPEHYVSSRDQARLERLRRFSLPEHEVERLCRLAEGLGLTFFSTPFDLASLAFLDRLCPLVKIASGDNQFFPLLEAAAATAKPLILSTGLADLAQLRRAVGLIEDSWARAGTKPGLALLHCVAAYPVAAEDANIGAIGALARAFPELVVGYSDHTLGIEAAVLSVAAGARIVEKHFTLAKDFSDFRDHQLSADPPEMAELVRRVRAANLMMGPGVKEPRACELANLSAMRRSVAAAGNLSAGTVLSADHITWVRPGEGVAPGQERLLLGRRLTRDIPAGELILQGDVA